MNTVNDLRYVLGKLLVSAGIGLEDGNDSAAGADATAAAAPHAALPYSTAGAPRCIGFEDGAIVRKDKAPVGKGRPGVTQFHGVVFDGQSPPRPYYVVGTKRVNAGRDARGGTQQRGGVDEFTGLVPSRGVAGGGIGVTRVPRASTAVEDDGDAWLAAEDGVPVGARGARTGGAGTTRPGKQGKHATETPTPTADVLTPRRKPGSLGEEGWRRVRSSSMRSLSAASGGGGSPISKGAPAGSAHSQHNPATWSAMLDKFADVVAEEQTAHRRRGSGALKRARAHDDDSETIMTGSVMSLPSFETAQPSPVVGGIWCTRTSSVGSASAQPQAGGGAGTGAAPPAVASPKSSFRRGGARKRTVSLVCGPDGGVPPPAGIDSAVGRPSATPADMSLPVSPISPQSGASAGDPISQAAFVASMGTDVLSPLASAQRHASFAAGIFECETEGGESASPAHSPRTLAPPSAARSPAPSRGAARPRRSVQSKALDQRRCNPIPGIIIPQGVARNRRGSRLSVRSSMGSPGQTWRGGWQRGSRAGSALAADDADDHHPASPLSAHGGTPTPAGVGEHLVRTSTATPAQRPHRAPTPLATFVPLQAAGAAGVMHGLDAVARAMLGATDVGAAADAAFTPGEEGAAPDAATPASFRSEVTLSVSPIFGCPASPPHHHVGAVGKMVSDDPIPEPSPSDAAGTDGPIGSGSLASDLGLEVDRRHGCADTAGSASATSSPRLEASAAAGDGEERTDQDMGHILQAPMEGAFFEDVRAVDSGLDGWLHSSVLSGAEGEGIAPAEVTMDKQSVSASDGDRGSDGGVGAQGRGANALADGGVEEDSGAAGEAEAAGTGRPTARGFVYQVDYVNPANVERAEEVNAGLGVPKRIDTPLLGREAERLYAATGTTPRAPAPPSEDTSAGAKFVRAAMKTSWLEKTIKHRKQARKTRADVMKAPPPPTWRAARPWMAKHQQQQQVPPKVAVHTKKIAHEPLDWGTTGEAIAHIHGRAPRTLRERHAALAAAAAARAAARNPLAALESFDVDVPLVDFSAGGGGAVVCGSRLATPVPRAHSSAATATPVVCGTSAEGPSVPPGGDHPGTPPSPPGVGGAAAAVEEHPPHDATTHARGAPQNTKQPTHAVHKWGRKNGRGGVAVGKRTTQLQHGVPRRGRAAPAAPLAASPATGSVSQTPPVGPWRGGSPNASFGGLLTHAASATPIALGVASIATPRDSADVLCELTMLPPVYDAGGDATAHTTDHTHEAAGPSRGASPTAPPSRAAPGGVAQLATQQPDVSDDAAAGRAEPAGAASPTPAPASATAAVPSSQDGEAAHGVPVEVDPPPVHEATAPPVREASTDGPDPAPRPADADNDAGGGAGGDTRRQSRGVISVPDTSGVRKPGVEAEPAEKAAKATKDKRMVVGGRRTPPVGRPQRPQSRTAPQGAAGAVVALPSDEIAKDLMDAYDRAMTATPDGMPIPRNALGTPVERELHEAYVRAVASVTPPPGVPSRPATQMSSSVSRPPTRPGSASTPRRPHAGTGPPTPTPSRVALCESPVGEGAKATLYAASGAPQAANTTATGTSAAGSTARGGGGIGNSHPHNAAARSNSVLHGSCSSTPAAAAGGAPAAYSWRMRRGMGNGRAAPAGGDGVTVKYSTRGPLCMVSVGAAGGGGACDDPHDDNSCGAHRASAVPQRCGDDATPAGVYATPGNVRPLDTLTLAGHGHAGEIDPLLPREHFLNFCAGGAVVDAGVLRSSYLAADNVWSTLRVCGSMSVHHAVEVPAIFDRRVFHYTETGLTGAYTATILHIRDPHRTGFHDRHLTDNERLVPLLKSSHSLDVVAYTTALGFAEEWAREVTTRLPLTFTNPFVVEIPGVGACRVDTPNPYDLPLMDRVYENAYEPPKPMYGVLNDDNSYSIYNDGVPCEEDMNGIVQVLECFAHFTYARSSCTLLCLVSKFVGTTPLEVILAMPDTDAGVDTGEAGHLPAIHHKSIYQGRERVSSFFEHHQCGRLCRQLRLPQVPYVPPKVVRVPQ